MLRIMERIKHTVLGCKEFGEKFYFLEHDE